jgi:5-methyltetrahydrofolate--homocysteine methyltransferase
VRNYAPRQHPLEQQEEMVTRSATETALHRIAQERILVLDGAMGTMIQELRLEERAYR